MDVKSNNSFLGNISEIGPMNGLVGWWPLDGHTKDLTSNRNDGINNGAVVTSGLGQSAYEFDSTTDSIEINNNILSIGEPHTVSLWIKPSSILPTGTSSSLRSTPFTGNGPVWSPGMWLTGSMIRVHAATEYRDYTINYNTTNWWHIGQIFDGTICYTIINGTVVLGTRTSYSPSNPTTFRIGNESASSSYYWDGKIQDVRIYNRVLSQEEINILYNLTNPEQKQRVINSNSGIVYTKGFFKETL
jgi:hypothetical protein